MKRILAALSVVLFANLASAEEPVDRYWACTGWDDTEYPDPFMIVHRYDGEFVLSDNMDEAYVIHPDYFKEFIVEKDPMTVVAHLIKAVNGELDKENSLVLTQRNRRLEVIRIDGVFGGALDPFRKTDRTYCNMIE